MFTSRARPKYSIVLLLILSGSATCLADGRQPRRPGSILYKVSQKADLVDLAAGAAVLTRHQGQALEALPKTKVDHALVELNGRTEEEVCAELIASGAVEFAEPDYLVGPVAIPDDPAYGNQWQHPKIQAPQAWDLVTGDGSVLVAICDTGVQSAHPDLAAALQLPGKNTVDDSTDTEPIHFHGTCVAGCVAAIGDNGVGVTGVAWDARILPIKISNRSDGYAYYSDMAEGIEWGADQGAKVINLSYGGAQSATINAAAGYARARGSLLFMSAGNDNTDISSWPDYSSFVLVGATNSGDTRASFSNYGTPIDIVAPGASIYSTTFSSGYTYASGTSFASPIAAGVAALMWMAEPSLSIDDLETSLFLTCDDLGGAGNDSVYGFGRVNAYAAVQAALSGGIQKAQITSPADGSTFDSSSVTFQWSAGSSVDRYWLEVGTPANPAAHFTGDMGTNLSHTVNTLPIDGSTVQARLWSRIGSFWLYNTYTYTAYTGASAEAEMTSPADGSTLSSSSQEFQWSSGTGVSKYWLEVGTAQNATAYYSGDMGTSQTYTVNGLPTNGSTIKVKLWSRIGSSWGYNTYTYTAHTGASAKAEMTSPANGSTLSSSSQEFQWSSGTGVSKYWLEVGTAQEPTAYFSGDMGTSQTHTVSGLPTNGSTIKVRLWSRIGSSWGYNTYTYTACTE
jgi:hypothetical protein